MTGNAPPLATLVTFSDFKLIKTRAVAQFIFEVPIEKADDVLADLGGLPVGAAERWCGIARVTAKAASAPLKAVEGPKKRWRDSTPTFQASIRCGEPAFWEFCTQLLPSGPPVDGQEAAAAFVRKWCGVTTRANIFAGEPSGDAWEILEGEYQAHIATRQYADVIR
jgi:hypothetical protein